MKLKIGILGTRGIPNAYGGYEQFAQHLAEGLVQKNHEVFVYNSSLHPYKKDSWNGVHLIHCKDAEDKLGSMGQFFYDRNCFDDARKRNFDVLLQLGYTSNSIWHRRWPKNALHIVNMDGLEWKRSKYSSLVRTFLKRAESWAANHADYLVADSKGIQEYLLVRYTKPSVYIPYGAKIFSAPDDNVISKFQLSPQQYFLVIARMEPENNIEMMMEGYLASGSDHTLVIVGNTNNKHGAYLSKKYKHQKIKFAGGIYDQDILNNLRFFSDRYFHGHSVGGTNPSLLEAMACGCTIAAHDNIFNRAVLQAEADYFSKPADITTIINQPLSTEVYEKRKELNRQKIETSYTWEKVIQSYENLMINGLRARK